jgi:Domain of unknown function (DUF3291)
VTPTGPEHPTFELAQVNIGRLVAPVDDPLLAEFMAALDPVNAAADNTPGFVWRLQAEEGNATGIAMSRTSRKRTQRAHCLNDRNASAARHSQFTDPLVASYAADSRLTTRWPVMGVAGKFSARDRKVNHAFTISQGACGAGGDWRRGRAGSRCRHPGVRCGHVTAGNVDDDSGEFVDLDVRLRLLDGVDGNG